MLQNSFVCRVEIGPKRFDRLKPESGPTRKPGPTCNSGVAGTLSDVVVYKVYKSLLKYDCKQTGSSHIKRHTEHCQLLPEENN